MPSQWRAAGTPSYSVTQLQENIFTFRGTLMDISSAGVVHLQKLTCAPRDFCAHYNSAWMTTFHRPNSYSFFIFIHTQCAQKCHLHFMLVKRMWSKFEGIYIQNINCGWFSVHCLDSLVNTQAWTCWDKKGFTKHHCRLVALYTRPSHLQSLSFKDVSGHRCVTTYLTWIFNLQELSLLSTVNQLTYQQGKLTF